MDARLVVLDEGNPSAAMLDRVAVQWMEAAGLERVEYWNLAAGVVALHRGYRF